MIFCLRRNPVEKVRIAVLYTLVTVVETVFLACGALGNSPSFGEDQVGAQEHRSYHQRPDVSVEPVDVKTSLEQFGAKLSRVPEIVRHQLVLNHNEGLAVDSVQKDSAADRIGLKPCDILVQFDKQYLLLPEQFSLLLDSYSRQRRGGNNKPSEVIFIRSGERRVITFSHNYHKQILERQLHESAMRNVGSRSQRISETSETQPHQVSSGATPPPTDITTRNTTSEPVVLLREDADCIIRLTQGEETRLQVHSLDKKCIFDELIISQESLRAVPERIRDRVNTMLYVLESHTKVIQENAKRSGFTEARTARLPTVNLIEKQPALRP